jgi:hypothetical protein
MEELDKARSRYFQTIAREFLERRGAPFFLSSKDVALVAGWERRGIPLQTVLEGIKRSFSSGRGKPRPRSKVQTLAYCEPEVLRAFAQHRERRVGRTHKVNARLQKAAKLRTEVQRFLDGLPSQVACLRPLFEQARELLSLAEVEEEKLETLEEEVEERLFCGSPVEFRQRLADEIRSESGGRKKDELESILRTKVIKCLRDEHMIPYLSLFYY